MMMMTIIAEDNVHWQVSANMAIEFWFYNNREFLSKLSSYDILMKYSTIWN
jgi:hypothetical protein